MLQRVPDGSNDLLLRACVPHQAAAHVDDEAHLPAVTPLDIGQIPPASQANGSRAAGPESIDNLFLWDDLGLRRLFRWGVLDTL